MSSNRVRLAGVRQPTWDTTPDTPRMRRMRFTGESLKYTPVFDTSEEIRDDRQTADPAKTGETNTGGVNFELSYPVDGSLFADVLASCFWNDWRETAKRDNDGAAASVITAIDAATQTVTVGAGTAFKAGDLVLFSGFSAAANKGVFPCTTGSATAPVFAAAGLVDDAAPAAAARLKVVGYQGAAGDLAAVADGLTSAGGIDFTTLGLVPGQTMKIGDTPAASRFAQAADNAHVRVVAIAAGKLTLDNLPTGWTADAGTGKTIRLLFGDLLGNGVTKIGVTLERGFVYQASPTFIAQETINGNQLQLTIAPKKKITGSVDFMGLRGSQGTVPLDASPDPAPDENSYPVFAAGVNLGRIRENGAQLAGINFVRQMSWTLANNGRAQDAIDQPASVDVNEGECAVSLDLQVAFGDNALLSRFFAGTPTSLISLLKKGGRAIVQQFPRLTYTDGSPNAAGKNQDISLPLKAQASRDALTGFQIMLERFEYWAD